VRRGRAHERALMQDHEISLWGGLEHLWHGEEVKLHLPSRVEVILECHGDHAWTGVSTCTAMRKVGGLVSTRCSWIPSFWLGCSDCWIRAAEARGWLWCLGGGTVRRLHRWPSSSQAKLRRPPRASWVTFSSLRSGRRSPASCPGHASSATITGGHLCLGGRRPILPHQALTPPARRRPHARG
jgi:hypothetical protein